MWIFPLGAAVVSGIFATLLAQRWLANARPHHLAWAIALAMFAIASFVASIGVLDVWTPVEFRLFYLFGAILNVPVLALGTVYLMAPRRIGHLVAALVGLATIFAAGAVFTAPLHRAGLSTQGIPSGREVMPEGVRTISRYFSYTGFAVVVGGALWSAARLGRKKDENLRRLAFANLLIAGGTFIVAVASVFARYGQGSIFSVGLLAGIVTMFAGFMKTQPRAAPPPETSDAAG
ncbi:MAG: hypothetical protein ACRDJ4_03565 [Actinomycetota bacterium]